MMLRLGANAYDRVTNVISYEECPEIIELIRSYSKK
jgi:hypothetical protein